MDAATLQALKKQAQDSLQQVLNVDVQKFMTDSEPDALILGEDAIDAILADATYLNLPVALVAKTPEQAAEREAIVAQRARNAAIISVAELKDAEAVKRVRARAIDTAKQIGGIVTALGLAAFKTYMTLGPSA